jgi:Cof subfamily protein (haloacid dehalogenase superfamily)
MIKLLALDLDGTVLDSRGRISPENKHAIKTAEANGVLVTIATGRRFRDCRPVGLELELNAPLITHNGALLKYGETLESVWYSLLSPDTAEEVIRVGGEFGGDALVSVDPSGKGTLLYSRVAEGDSPVRNYLAWAQRLHGDEAEEAVVHVDDLVASARRSAVIHISFSGTCASMLALREFLETELGEKVTILATIYPKLDFTLLDILPPNVSKGSGLERLAAAGGLLPEHVMCIGDNHNDLHMLEFAGTPVVMGNAEPSLLDRPEFYKTLTNDQSGVAAAIERFILI